MSKFIVEERFGRVPVRVSLMIERELYDEAEQVARLLGKGTIENLIISLLKETVEEMKNEGFKIKPFWKEGDNE